MFAAVTAADDDDNDDNDSDDDGDDDEDNDDDDHDNKYGDDAPPAAAASWILYCLQNLMIASASTSLHNDVLPTPVFAKPHTSTQTSGLQWAALFTLPGFDAVYSLPP